MRFAPSIVLFLCCSVGALLLPETLLPVYAQNDEEPELQDEGPVKPTGVAATMIAASLETDGYLMQSIILRDLKGILKWLGILIYVASAMFALAYFAIYHEYDQGLWFLLGPPIFHFILTTTPSAGVDWQVGREKGIEPDGVNAAISETVNANVSILFHEWNKIVSDIVQQSVAIISEMGSEEGKSLRSQLIPMIRQQIFESLFRTEISHPGLRALIHEGLHIQCVNVMEAARYIALGKRSNTVVATPAYQEKLGVYTFEFGRIDHQSNSPSPNFSADEANRVLEQRKVRIIKTEPARKYAADILSWLKYRREAIPNQSAQPNENFFEWFLLNRIDPKDLENPQKTVRYPVSCGQIWDWAFIGIARQVSGEVKKLDEATLAKLKSEKPEMYNELWLSIAAKLIPLPDISLKAKNGKDGSEPKLEFEKDALDLLGSLGIEEDNLDDALKRLFSITHSRVDPDISIIPVVLAGTLLRKELTRNADQSLLAQVEEHAGYERQEFDFAPGITREQTQEVSRRFAADGEAHRKRYEIYTFANSLPYLQGVILYFLAISFPFFALLVLIPGHAGNFFQWMALWGWVKSWDIGWAIVMVADDVLWSLMPKSATYDVFVDPRQAPITVFESAFHGDPAYNLTNYYMIIGTMLLAVPIITAQAVLGGKSVIGSFLVTGLNEMGETFGKSAFDWVLHNSISKETRLREMWAAKFAIAKMGEDANEQAEAYRTKVEEQSQKGGWWLTAGQLVGAGLAIGGGIALAFTGIGLVGGLGMIASGLTIGHAALKAEHNIKRDTHLAMARYNRGNAMLHYYNTVNEDWYYHMEAIRGGLSGRGEFWNYPDAANIEGVNILAQGALEFELNTRRHFTEGVVGMGAGALAGLGGGLAGRLGGAVLSKFFVQPAAGAALRPLVGGVGEGVIGQAVRGVPIVGNRIMNRVGTELAGRSASEYALGRLISSRLGEQIYAKEIARHGLHFAAAASGTATQLLGQRGIQAAAMAWQIGLHSGAVIGSTYAVNAVVDPVIGWVSSNTWIQKRLLDSASAIPWFGSIEEHLRVTNVLRVHEEVNRGFAPKE